MQAMACVRRTMALDIIIAYYAYTACISVVTSALGLMTSRLSSEKRSWAVEAIGAARIELANKRGRVTEAALVSEAARLLDIMHPGHGISNKHRFIRTWWPRLAKGDTREAPRGPRSPISDEQCHVCIDEIRKGVPTSDGHFEPFVNIRQARLYCTTLNHLMNKYRYTDAGMLGRLRAADPGLRHYKARVKPHLSDTLKQERITVCNFLLKQPLEYFKRIFWLDCKTLYCKPKAGYVLIHEADRHKLVIEDERQNFKFADTIRIQLYAMCNWHEGIVAMWLTQGTTGQPLRFSVSSMLVAAIHCYIMRRAGGELKTELDAIYTGQALVPSRCTTDLASRGSHSMTSSTCSLSTPTP